MHSLSFSLPPVAALQSLPPQQLTAVELVNRPQGQFAVGKLHLASKSETQGPIVADHGRSWQVVADQHMTNVGDLECSCNAVGMHLPLVLLSTGFLSAPA